MKMKLSARCLNYSLYSEFQLFDFLVELINVLDYFPDVFCYFSLELEVLLNGSHILT